MTSDERILAISDHVEATIGKLGLVFHEGVSDELHIDILWVRSTWLRRYEVFATSGMSELPMAVPEGIEAPKFAELTMALPRGWPFGGEPWKDIRYYWPVKMLKILARWPLQGKTWLGDGHTVDLSEIAPDMPFRAAMVAKPTTLRPAAHVLTTADGRTTHFWSVVPLHDAELQLARTAGTAELRRRLTARGIGDRIDPARPSVA